MAFANFISATWWEIIRNWGATFIVNFDSTDHKVELPEFPGVQKEIEFTNEKIGDFGRVKKLCLRYCGHEVPEFFRGIAVQRGGMTILRIPVSAEEAVKYRVYGYCTFDDDLERELKKVEFPNHLGFMDKKAWNHVKEYIKRKLEDFVQEISPIKKKEISLPPDLVDRAVIIVNNLVREYAPELTARVIGTGGSKNPTETHQTKRSIPDIRIDTFRGNARKLEYDQSLITECELVNDTEAAAKMTLTIEVRHEEGYLKFNPRYPRYAITLDSKKREKIDIPLIDFEENVDKPGEYIATGMLEIEGVSEPHIRTFTFYLHEEPPAPKGGVFLSTMVFSKSKGTPLERKKQLPVTDKGILRIIWDHPDFVHTRELANSKKVRSNEMLIYMVKCGVDESVQKLLEFRYNEGQLDADQIRDIKNRCDAMYYDAISSPAV